MSRLHPTATSPLSDKMPPPSASEIRFIDDLRSSIDSQLQSSGLISAFMASLACASYSQPPPDPQCFGETGVRWITMLSWLSIGAFFTSFMLSAVLAADITGVFDDKLVGHLRTVQAVHSSIPLLVFYGVSALAAAYGVDLGERNGCAFSYFGLATAPCLPVLVFAVWWWLRRTRRKLIAPQKIHSLTTWLDRIPEKYGGGGGKQ
ncbi:hypothetical protein TrST_g12085 [Triparma strigata]|uniref:Uncharacterized protein n=1 Tax=Triparma strigata TaxID=1606541 RepID=A0A9W7BLI7_9STRA|nr:hypothetical protein TrST_g12085 [Triparma strigata]